MARTWTSWSTSALCMRRTSVLIRAPSDSARDDPLDLVFCGRTNTVYLFLRLCAQRETGFSTRHSIATRLVPHGDVPVEGASTRSRRETPGVGCGEANTQLVDRRKGLFAVPPRDGPPWVLHWLGGRVVILGIVWNRRVEDEPTCVDFDQRVVAKPQARVHRHA